MTRRALLALGLAAPRPPDKCVQYVATGPANAVYTLQLPQETIVSAIEELTTQFSPAPVPGYITQLKTEFARAEAVTFVLTTHCQLRDIKKAIASLADAEAWRGK